MKRIAVAVILSAIVSAPSVAADMYVGIRAGQANSSIDNVVLTDDSDSAWGVFGGYAFNPNFAVEVEYVDLGKVTGGGGGVESTGFSVSGVGSFPVNDQFSLFGKLGYAMITSEDTSPAPGPDADSDAVTYGVGGQYNFSPAVGIRLGWDRYKYDDSAQSLQGDADLISVGAVFKF